MRLLVSLLLLLSGSQLFGIGEGNPPVRTQVQFYSTTLDISFDPLMRQKNQHCTSNPCLKRFFKKLESSDYDILLEDLKRHQEALNLNDWFFFNLVTQAVESIYPDQTDMYQTTVTWFLMVKLGYDVRLFTSKSKFTFLYARTEDMVYEAPFVRLFDNRYINLTSVYHGLNTRRIVFEMPKYQPGVVNKKPFSFQIDHMPQLPSKEIEKELQFNLNGEDIVLNFKVDTLGKEMLNHFPITDPINYIKVPLSEVTMNSLKESLAPHLEGKTQAEQLSTLVTFTRKAFDYKNDQIRFRRDKPLTADQLMMADTSDFEDRCALFYNILKETTDLNFIVVKYIHDDIITIGVELPEVVGRPFEHEGIKYTICDPTMPRNSSKLGLYPINLDKDIEILEIVRR